MIGLPAGCSINYAITIELRQMTNEIVDWYQLAGGRVETKEHYNHRGNRVTLKYVSYGNGKQCHYRQDGSGGVRLHFQGLDASAASMFLIKFYDVIESHNLKEHMERMAADVE